jgi:hypothetical protein
MVNLRVDYDIYKAFRLKAVELDTNLTEVILKAMKEYMDKEKEETQQRRRKNKK